MRLCREIPEPRSSDFAAIAGVGNARDQQSLALRVEEHRAAAHCDRVGEMSVVSPLRRGRQAPEPIVVADGGHFVDRLAGLIRPSSAARRPVHPQEALGERFEPAVPGGVDGLPSLLGGDFGGVDGLSPLLGGDPGRVERLLPLAPDPDDADPQDQDAHQQHQEACGDQATMALGPLPGAVVQAGPAGEDGFADEEPQQVFGQLLRGGITRVGLLGDGLEDDRLEVAVDPGIGAAGRLRGVRPHLLNRLQDRITPERRPAGQEGVEDRAEAVDVGPGRDLLRPPAGLLRGHVRR